MRSPWRHSIKQERSAEVFGCAKGVSKLELRGGENEAKSSVLSAMKEENAAREAETARISWGQRCVSGSYWGPRRALGGHRYVQFTPSFQRNAYNTHSAPRQPRGVYWTPPQKGPMLMVHSGPRKQFKCGFGLHKNGCCLRL